MKVENTVSLFSNSLAVNAADMDEHLAHKKVSIYLFTKMSTKCFFLSFEDSFHIRLLKEYFTFFQKSYHDFCVTFSSLNISYKEFLQVLFLGYDVMYFIV